MSRDEILYNAKIHPEQYTDSLTDIQLNQLYESMLNVCSIAVETLADQERFPEEWLMKHRSSRGKKDKKLPNGQKIDFVKVGGRTSAFIPAVQKKTGPTANEDTGIAKKAADVDDDESQIGDSKLAKKRATAPKTKKSALEKIGRRKRKTKDEDEDEEGDEDEDADDANGVEGEGDEESAEDEEPEPTSKKLKTSKTDRPSNNKHPRKVATSVKTRNEIKTFFEPRRRK
jgi:formamidopyrimidine-DNA glycosylase